MKKLILAKGVRGKMIALRVNHGKNGLSQTARAEINLALGEKWVSVIYLENVLTLATDAEKTLKKIYDIFEDR